MHLAIRTWCQILTQIVLLVCLLDLRLVLTEAEDWDTISLRTNKQCLCSGDTLTYECTTFGDSGGAIATIWTGTAFDCPQTENKLTLLHTLSFTDTNPLICNDGAILVRGILVVSGGNYTSQLNITVNSDMNGQTVECFYDNGFRTQVVSNFSIMLTTGMAKLAAELYV